MTDQRNVAIELAYHAGKIMKDNFSLGMKKSWKNNQSPVTTTDLTINSLVIHTLAEKFPSHAVLGEEESNTRKSEYVWVCDPVDGTVPFSHGVPTFVFSLALVRDGAPLLGVIYDPVLDRLIIAEKGKGAFLNNKPIHVSKKTSVKNAPVNIDSEHPATIITNIDSDAFITSMNSAVYAGMLVALGEFVGEIYTYPHPWDGAAIKIIVEEAGGKVTDIKGQNQRYDCPIHGYIASNGSIHDILLKAVA